MPGFGGRTTDANALSDRNIVALGNYMLTHFGSADTTIAEQQVAEARRGGPLFSTARSRARRHGSRGGYRASGHCTSHLPKTKAFGLTCHA
jgi:hypothetical protein